MGLLTDAKQRQWLVKAILRYHAKLSVLLYVGGLLWFLALAYRPLNAGTYFSENALLPGLVESNLPQGFSSLYTYSNALKEQMKEDKKRAPKEWIFKQFQELGLDTYRHNFTVKYPFKMAVKEALTGENVYAILRARRAASTEALVMMAPLRSAGSSRAQTDGGIALMLGLAEQFRRNPYWAKDVIFLLSEMEEVGVLAWLNAYHETKSPYIVADDLPGRSGPIQAAINLEIPSDKVRYLNLKLEGLNGQLPNLDLFNLAVRLGRREHVHVTLHDRGDHHDQESWEGFQYMLGTMFSMMWTQASGAPSGCHGLFHRFHIEALTVQGVRLPKGYRSYSLEQLARVVEGIFRSLNNLLERFHQSFFFYILPSTDRYISIGLYMPPFGLMVVAGVIEALALWIIATSVETTENEDDKTGADNKEAAAKEKEDKGPDGEDAAKGKTGEEGEGHKEESDVASGKPHNDSKAEKKKSLDDEGKIPQDAAPAEDDADSDEEDDFELSEKFKTVMNVAPVVLMSFTLGLFAYTAPHLMTRFEPTMRMSPFDMIMYTMLAIFASALTYPYLLMRKTAPEYQVSTNWHLLKCLGLLLQALTLFAVSLINISLAFFIAVTSLPVMMAVRAAKSWFLKGLQMTVLLVISPMGLLCFASMLSLVLNGSDTTWSFSFGATVDEMKNLLFLMLVDQYLFTSWTYLLITVAFFPAWLLFWFIPFCQV